MQEAPSQFQEAESQRTLIFQAVGVAEANMSILGMLSKRAPIKLKGLEFDRLFTVLRHLRGFLWLRFSEGVKHSGTEMLEVGQAKRLPQDRPQSVVERRFPRAPGD